ncbi:MAG: hypothetical protein RIS29_1741 [Bacteroidota bacterium]|jgi:RNA recognition motif-containing protein
MNIFVAKLSFNVNDEDLNVLFAEYGEVSSARVVTDKITRRSKGYGFVEMPDDAAAQKAISELNECEFDGRVIAVSEARPREERPAGDRRPSGGGYGSNRGGGYGGGNSRRY